MVVMLVVVGAVVLVVLVVGGASLLRRPRGGDLSSVERYHHALGTMEHITERSGGKPLSVRYPAPPGRRGVSGPDVTEGGDDLRPAPSESPDPTADAPRFERGGPFVFDDTRSRNVSPARPRTDRAQRNALESMNHRPRRVGASVVAVAVVVGVGALAYVGSRHHSSGSGRTAAPSSSTTPSRTRTTAPVTRTTASTTRTTTSTGHSGDSAAKGRGSGHHTKSRTNPTTTVPPSITASSTGTGVATYPVPSATYTMTVSASAPCWVLAQSTSGATLWTGTLQAGGVQSIPASGTVTVELGSSAGTLQVDNIPVVLPTPIQTPFVATFQPPVTSPGATSPTTSPAAG